MGECESGGCSPCVPLSGLAGNYQVGAKRSICCLGNDAPICVGVMDVNSSQVDPSARNQGKGLVVMHHYGDTLWESGNRVNPNAGFLRDRVTAVQTAAQISPQVKELVGSNVKFLDEGDTEEGEAKGSEEVTIRTGGSDLSSEFQSECTITTTTTSVTTTTTTAPLQTREEGDVRSDSSGSSSSSDSGSSSADVVDAPSESPPSGGEEEEPGDSADGEQVESGEGLEEEESLEGGDGVDTEEVGGAEEKSGISVAEMDNAIETAFLFALSSRIGVDDLPLDCSSLMSRHMAVCNLSPFRLDFKRSSFRQLAKFIHEMAKRGIIRERNTRGVLTIFGINRAHPTLVAFTVTKEMTSKAKKNTASLKAVHSASQPGDPLPTETPRQLQVVYMYSPSAKLRPLFPSGRPLYSGAEATQLLWDYCSKEGLDQGKEVRLDPILANLFKPPIPDTASKADLATRFRAGLETHYAVMGGAEEAKFKPGTEPKITVANVVAGKKSKKLTQITGLEAYGVSPEEVARIAPKKFASSCTTAPLDGKKNVGKAMVVLQGSFVSEVVQFLHAEFGIPLVCFKQEAKK